LFLHISLFGIYWIGEEASYPLVPLVDLFLRGVAMMKKLQRRFYAFKDFSWNEQLSLWLGGLSMCESPLLGSVT